jgi:hypothetical protein
MGHASHDCGSNHLWCRSRATLVLPGLDRADFRTIVPVYQSEISPPHNRGKLACIEFTGNVVGYASSVWVDYFCSFVQSDWSWRAPLFMQCVMGALLALGSLVISETPRYYSFVTLLMGRWLLDNDHDEDGMIVIAMLHGGGDVTSPVARDEYREIKRNILIQRTEGERTYSEMFTRYRTRLLIAMSSQAFAQLNGINVISYYAPLVFEQAGWVGRDAILMTGINGIIYVLSTIPPYVPTQISLTVDGTLWTGGGDDLFLYLGALLWQLHWRVFPTSFIWIFHGRRKWLSSL